MRLLAVALLCMSSAASAAPSTVVGGTALTLDPSTSPDSGQGLGWLAYSPAGTWYVGGELALGSPQVDHAEFALSYHALAGTSVSLSPAWAMLFDGGIGVSQQADAQLHLLSDDGMEMSTRAWTPSAAARVHFVAGLGKLHNNRAGIALVADARSTLDSSAALELGVGLGIYIGP